MSKNQTIFLIGAAIGVLLSHSGIVGFSAGFVSGIMFAKYYWTEDWVHIDTDDNNQLHKTVEWLKKQIFSFLGN